MNDSISKLYSDTDLSPLSRVTLVIPTHNRNFYLSRCLWYHAHFPFAEIIIADSSLQEKREINKKTIHELTQQYQTKITYLEYDYPPEEYGGEIYKKWGDAISHITTEYALSCTDKEFLIPTTVVSSVVFLDTHEDYSLADGKYYVVNSKKEIFQWQGNESITDNLPSQRLDRLTKNVIGTQFAVNRAKDYMHIFENMKKYELFDIRFGETIIETMPILKGKLNRDNNMVMSIRDRTEQHKQNNIFNVITNNMEKAKAESSYSRYIDYANYPSKRRDSLLNNYKKCIENNITIEGNVAFYDKIMNVRYTSSVNNQFFNFCWNYLTPYKIKYVLSHLFGMGKVETKINPLNEPKTITYIFNLILKTRKYISQDTPITQTTIFQGDLK